MRRRDLLVGLVSMALLGGCASGGSSGAKAPATGSGQRDLVFTLEREQFGKFLQLIRAADYVGKLQGAGPFTLFAPNDSALGEISQGDLARLLRPQNRAKLRALLDRHIVAGHLPRQVLTSTKSLKTIDGSVIALERRGQTLIYGTGNLVRVNIGASNGVIHAIDRVQLPPRLL